MKVITNYLHVETFSNANVMKNVKKVIVYGKNLRKTLKIYCAKKTWIVKDKNNCWSFNVFCRYSGKTKTKVKGHIYGNLANNFKLDGGCNAKSLSLWCVDWET